MNKYGYKVVRNVNDRLLSWIEDKTEHFKEEIPVEYKPNKWARSRDKSPLYVWEEHQKDHAIWFCHNPGDELWGCEYKPTGEPCMEGAKASMIRLTTPILPNHPRQKRTLRNLIPPLHRLLKHLCLRLWTSPTISRILNRRR